jgi:hypothetical protein
MSLFSIVKQKCRLMAQSTERTEAHSGKVGQVETTSPATVKFRTK